MGALLFAIVVMAGLCLAYGVVRGIEWLIHRPLMADEPGWVIRGPIGDEDERLYWSNDDGWVDRASATIFPTNDLPLPQYARGWERDA